MSLLSKIRINFQLAQTKVNTDNSISSAPVQRDYLTDLGDGTAAGKADLTYHATRTIAPSANDDLDLAGVLTDAFGATLTFARIKSLTIVAAAANVNNVVVGGGASNPVTSFMSGTTPAVIVRPGTAFHLQTGSADATGYVVTAATADILRVTNGGAGASVTYDIVIVGCSA
jgi:hypothetical protein